MAGICAVLVLACAVIYGQTLYFGYVNYDDEVYVKDAHAQAGLSLPSIAWAFTTEKGLYFHPLAWMSHMLDTNLYGRHPSGRHLTSLVLHAAASALLFLALRFLTGTLWPSAVVAALFATHPLNVESVAWIAERKGVLCALFWVVAIGVYGLYARRGGAGRYVAVAAACILGFMSKPMAVTLPFTLLLLDYWPLERVDRAASLGGIARRMGRLTLEKTPLLLLSVLSCVSTFGMQERGNNIDLGARISVAARCANALIVYVIYLTKCAWPSGLAAFYPHPGGRPIWQVTGAVVLLVAITLICVSQARRRPYLIVGWFWYLGTLVPVIGFVGIGSFSHADRYTYVPLIGIFIMAVWGLAELAETWNVPKRVVVVATGTALVALTACAGVQVSYWRESETLFRRAIDVGQESSLAYSSLGVVAMEKKDYKEAKRLLLKSLDLAPDSLSALNNLSSLALKWQRYDDAKFLLDRAMRLYPEDARVLTNMGALALNQGSYDDAKAYLTKALNTDPESVDTLYNLAFLALAQRRNDDAKTYLKRTLERDPERVSALNGLGVCLMNQDKYEEAQQYFRKALEIEPQNAGYLNNLGEALAKLGRQEEADGYLRRAAELGQAGMGGKK